MKYLHKNRSVAAKIQLQEHVDRNEKEIWPYLGHENLLPLISVDYFPATCSYVFITPVHPASLAEMVEGSHLAEYRNGMERALSWQHGVLSGLNYLHSRKLCYLDLKLSNILIREDDTALICNLRSITRTERITDRLGLNFAYHYIWQR